MALSKNANTAWSGLHPDVMEQVVPETEGFIAFDDLRAASQTLAPGLEEAFGIWGRGITASNAGIPLREWRAFLRALRRDRQSMASRADAGD
jgi:hypothetical protein